jgi:hypothetical protein
MHEISASIAPLQVSLAPSYLGELVDEGNEVKIVEAVVQISG